MCTSFRLIADDGAVVVGRTMEFAEQLDSQLLAVPEGTTVDGTAPDGHEALTWTTTHGFIAMNGLHSALALDGVNDAGLFVSTLYFPGFVGYQVPGDGLHLTPEEVVGWLLGTCATVDEVADAVASATVWAHTAGPLGGPLPLHFVAHDRAGGCVVVEHVGGEVQVHENPIGVITNSPPFDWHLVNLRNHVNLSATNVPHLDLHGVEVHALGQGSGLLGLPGDWTPPSRFVRAVSITQSVSGLEDADAAVAQAVHVQYDFEIPRGVIRPSHHEPLEFTQWTSIADLQQGRYLVRFYDDPRWHEASVADTLATIDGPTTFPLVHPVRRWAEPVDLTAGTPIDPDDRPF